MASASVHPPEKESAKPAWPLSREAVAAFLADPNAKLTPEMFATLLLGLADCELSDLGIDYKCPGRRMFREGLNHAVSDEMGIPRVASELLRHAAPPVRYEAAFRAGFGAFAADAEEGAATRYLDAFAAERDPNVLIALTRGSAGGLSRSQPLRKAVMALVKHENEYVRTTALQELGRPESALSVEGFLPAVVDRLQNDASGFVRGAACSVVAATGAGMQALEKAAQDAKAAGDAFVRGQCLYGAIRSWVKPSSGVVPSKRGFEVTLKLLEDPAREKKFPHPELIVLKVARPPRKGEEPSPWYASVKSFYDVERLAKALADIAADARVATETRRHALEVLFVLEEPKRLEALAKFLKKAGPESAEIAARAEELAKKAQP